MSMPSHAGPLATVAAIACASCSSPTSSEATQASEATETAETSEASETESSEDTGTTSGKQDSMTQGVEGIELMPALAGLWTGPVSMTPLGSYPTMNMDTQFVDGQVTFSRVDLDPTNSLRFEFLVETVASTDTLVYRNGGYFTGMLRDTRSVLVEHEGVAGVGPADYRFCALDGGCDYIDAHWEFSDPDHLVLDVSVQGVQHVFWLAERVQPRPVPEGIPETIESQGNGDAPFPELPSLRVDVTWMDPLVDPADAWVLLSKQDCGLFDFCDFSRSLSTAVEADATEAQLLIEQLHPGDYKLTAFLDRDRNLQQTLFPGPGDGVSIPNQAVHVAAQGESLTDAPIVVDL